MNWFTWFIALWIPQLTVIPAPSQVPQCHLKFVDFDAVVHRGVPQGFARAGGALIHGAAVQLVTAGDLLMWRIEWWKWAIAAIMSYYELLANQYDIINMEKKIINLQQLLANSKQMVFYS